MGRPACVPSSSPTLWPICDGLDVNVTYNFTWFHLNHGMVSRQIYILSLYGGHSIFFFFFSHTSTFQLAAGQAVVTGVVPFPPRFLPSIFIAHRVQQSHCSSILHRVLLTHALALSASQFVRKKKSPRIYTRMHSGGFELTKLTYTRLEDNLTRHRSDRL